MSLDWSILYWIQSHTVCDLFDLLMPKLTLLGSGGAVWLLAAGGLLCTKKYRRQGVILLAGLAVGALVGNMCLKNLIARSRPCWLDDSVFMLISVPTDYSFPSGHTLASAIGATVLTKTNRRFGWAAIPLAVIIAFFPPVPVRPFPQRHSGRGGAGRGHRGSGASFRYGPTTKTRSSPRQLSRFSAPSLRPTV